MFSCTFLSGCEDEKDADEKEEIIVDSQINDNNETIMENKQDKEAEQQQTSENIPDYYSTYAELLTEHMSDTTKLYEFEYEAIPYSMGYEYFILKDLNHDGREELLLGYAESPSDIQEWNLIIPAATWEEANKGLVTGYDEESGCLFRCSGDLGEICNYYQLSEDELVEVEKYEWIDDTETGGGNSFYYYDSDGNQTIITENQYNEQEGKDWSGRISGNWILLNAENVNMFFSQNSDIFDIQESNQITELYGEWDNYAIVESMAEEIGIEFLENHKVQIYMGGREEYEGDYDIDDNIITIFAKGVSRYNNASEDWENLDAEYIFECEMLDNILEVYYTSPDSMDKYGPFELQYKGDFQ
jgi:hypothetical protein